MFFFLTFYQKFHTTKPNSNDLNLFKLLFILLPLAYKYLWYGTNIISLSRFLWYYMHSVAVTKIVQKDRHRKHYERFS